MNIISPEQFELDPLEIDPRPCELCGLTVDRHEMVDHGEGPEFFCADLSPDEMTLDELERRAELRRQEDIVAIMARMDAMDGPDDLPPPVNLSPTAPPPQPSMRFGTWSVFAIPSGSRPGSPIGRKTRRFCSYFWKPSDAGNGRSNPYCQACRCGDGPWQDGCPASRQ
jgi:hypothetical protein